MGFDYSDEINSLNDLKQSDFPGFFTVKRLILLIDGKLLKKNIHDVYIKEKSLLDCTFLLKKLK